MAGITFDQAQAKLDQWMEADAAVARKQSYSIAGRSLTLTDAREIRENIEYWNDQVQKLAVRGPGRRGPRYGVSE